MKVWQKVLIATIGSGLAGGFTYAASVFPVWAIPLGLLSTTSTAILSILIGWPPKET